MKTKCKPVVGSCWWWCGGLAVVALEREREGWEAQEKEEGGRIGGGVADWWSPERERERGAVKVWWF